MTIALLLLILALVVYGLERNNSRQSQPRERLAGSTDAKDRIVTRVHLA